MNKKPNMSGLKPFVKGQSGNPGGRLKLPDDIKEARKLNQIELERLVNKYLWLTADEVKALDKNPATPMMERMILSIVSIAAEKGDQQRLEFILCRLIGKVKDQIEVSTVKPYIVNHMDGTQTVLGAAPEVLPQADWKEPTPERHRDREGIDWKDP